MQELYRRRETTPGLPKIDALRQAQIALLHGQQPAGDVVAHKTQSLSVTAAEHSDGSEVARLRVPLPAGPPMPTRAASCATLSLPVILAV
jgi:hypothetical protein